MGKLNFIVNCHFFISLFLGKEFYNSHFQKLMLKHNINHYSSFSEVKSALAERFVRTIKTKIYKEIALRASERYIDFLDEIIDDYNNTKHSKTKMKPNSIQRKHEQDILKNIYNDNKRVILKKPKFSIGQSVRISRKKHIFSKGYEPQWTTEIFKISQINKKFPVTYLLSNKAGNEQIRGCFYEPELTSVKNDDLYLIEKVLKRQKSWLFVKCK